MCPATTPLTPDEIAVVYRLEKDKSPLAQVRPDFYPAAADLLAGLRREYQREMAKDPDSLIAEGINQRRKSLESQLKFIVSTRTKKIANMSVLGAEDAKVKLDLLTPEERGYYDQLVSLNRRHMSAVGFPRGPPTVATRIDEPPARPAGGPDGFPPPPPEDEAGEEPEIDEPFPEEAAEPEPEEDGPDLDCRPVLVRVLEDLPEFVGPDRSYRLSKEDVVTLPKALADILVNTQKAVAVAPTP